jgi:hypothetical protein
VVGTDNVAGLTADCVKVSHDFAMMPLWRDVKRAS